MNQLSTKQLKRSKSMQIYAAMLEYLISILVSGSFLATLTKDLGLSDELTGILSSIVSLGCLFQLLSIFVKRTRVKRIVIIFNMINQCLFMLLYVIPLTSFGKQTKIAIFVVLILAAYLLHNLVQPQKTNWLASVIEHRVRGRFTADKEIVSLVSGIVFSFGMGAVVDHFSETGNTRAAFIVSAAVIFVLMALYSLSLLLVTETETPRPPKKNLKSTVKELINNKSILHITVVFLLYNVSTYIAVPFYGTYQINELGLSLKTVSAIAICGSASRITVSKFWGTYADKTSFAKMIEKCFIFLALARLCVVFAVPTNGIVMFVLYNILHGIAFGGINSALTNLIFENIPPEKQTDALAITQAFSGIAGFLTTLCVSPLVSFIQSSGNRLFGLPIYAQQFVTVLSLVFTVIAILYTRTVFINAKRK